jgi:hypothetical protein
MLDRVRNRAERLRQYRWRMGRHRSSGRHIVLGGSPRSGTTILRKLLDRHPEVCCGAETKLFVPAAFNLTWLAQAYHLPRPELEAMRRGAATQAAFVDAFAERATVVAGKDRWAEKTPQNIRHLGWILERFPAAVVVHIVRDGRDVVCSMREHPDWRWVGGTWRRALRPRPLARYAERWLADTAAGMAWRADPRYVEIRYEDLVAEPVAVMRGLADAIAVAADLDWLAQVAGGALSGAPGLDAAATPAGGPDYEGAVSAGSVGRWRRDLAAAEAQEVERLCASRLTELGYAV